MGQLRAHRFDGAFELKGDLRHHLLLALAGIPFRAGYGVTGGGFLAHRVLEWNGSEHAVDANLRFLDCLQAPSPAAARPNVIPRLPWNPTAAERGWLDGLIGDRPLLVFHPDAGTPAKRWPAARFAALMERAAARGFQTVLAGTNPALGKQVQSAAPAAGAIDLMGRTTLPQLITLLQASRGIVSSDSGPAHLAAAVGRPVFALWSGTSDPARWRPRGEVMLVRHAVACEFCQHVHCPKPVHDCMEGLSLDEVTMPFQSFLERAYAAKGVP